MDDVTDDAFLGGRLHLLQPARGHRAGHDALLLAASTAARCGDRVIEFGAGVGAAALTLGARVPGLVLTLIERDPALAALAQRNAARNTIVADVVTGDVTAKAATFAAAGIAPDSADAVLMNPPFNAPERHRASPDPVRRDAHLATATLLADWIDAARHVLKPRGVLTLIWRADGLADVLAGLQRGFGSIAVQPVYPAQHRPAIRIVVRALKDGRAPLVVQPGLILSMDFQDKAAALTPLPLAME